MVVSGDDGLDELSITARTRVIEVADGGTEEWFVEAEGLGLTPASLDEIRGGEPEENAAVVKEIFDGSSGPARDIAVLNAGATIFVAGQADDLAAGVEKAGESLASGAAADVLEKVVARSAQLAGAAS
jgi:anthranilate phosphoribosyltransferase